MKVAQTSYQVCKVFLLSLVVIAAVAIPSVGQDEIYEGSTITGTVLSFNGRVGSQSRPFHLIIKRYTPPAEVERLNSTLKSGGQDQLLDEISKLSAGQIQIGNGVGVRANVIYAQPVGDGETKITVIYERYVNFSELRYGARSSDYRFGYGEVYLRRNGLGQGTLIPAAKIRLRGGNTWEVEDFGIYPARLLGLKAYGGLVPR